MVMWRFRVPLIRVEASLRLSDLMYHTKQKNGGLCAINTYYMQKLRNIAIIAHVDHGKTTLVDKKIACQDPVKSRGIKKKENKTEMNNTNLILSDESEKMKNRELLEEYFSCSLEVDLLLRLYPDDEDTLYQIVNLLVDTYATNRKLLHIAGDDKPAEVVRSRFMKLNADHIRFVLKCLAENSSPIRNMKQYLLASLYNAPTTMQLSYQNQTNHDLANRM